MTSVAVLIRDSSSAFACTLAATSEIVARKTLDVTGKMATMISKARTQPFDSFRRFHWLILSKVKGKLRLVSPENTISDAGESCMSKTFSTSTFPIPLVEQ
jgi:hypothetical protein